MTDWADEIAERFRAEWSLHGAVTDCQEEFRSAVAAALRRAYQRGYDQADRDCENAHGEF